MTLSDRFSLWFHRNCRILIKMQVRHSWARLRGFESDVVAICVTWPYDNEYERNGVFLSAFLVDSNSGPIESSSCEIKIHVRPSWDRLWGTEPNVLHPR